MKINIDKLFRNTINGSKPTVPKEIWFAIEAELKRKRILRFLYIFFGVSLISLTGYLFLFSETERNPTIKNLSHHYLIKIINPLKKLLFLKKRLWIRLLINK